MSFFSVKESIANQPGVHGEEQRELLTQSLDTWLGQLLAASIAQTTADASDFALIAVGSLGRGEPTLRSDLDLVLLHQPRARHAEKVAAGIWYPIWDSGMSLDHSVRTIAEARAMAMRDPKVVTGLLDARLVAGDSELGSRLHQDIHADWRKSSAKMLPQLRDLVAERRSRSGDLFQLLEPDLKESYGGLRDVGILRALGATWRVETGQADWLDSAKFLLDVRSRMHLKSRSDRLRLQDQPEIAQDLGFRNAAELLRSIYLAGRKIAYASDRAWGQLERTKGKRDVRRPIADGVVIHGGEVVLAKTVMPDLESGHNIVEMTLSVAAAASIAELPISPFLLGWLSKSGLEIAPVWNSAMRNSLLQLLGSRFGMLSTWESLDQFDLISRWLPEWEHVRSLPQFNSLHEFTVDRHLVECVVQGQELTRTVKRPDLLLMACLLHDIGKGLAGDHSVVGAQMTREIMSRMGFKDQEVHSVELLVLHHLLLADTATRRDIEDPAVIDSLCAHLESPDNIELLLALTLADSRATGPSLRSQWRENLIIDAAQRAIQKLSGKIPAKSEPVFDGSMYSPDSDGVIFHSESESDGYRVVIGLPDQIGLLTAVAGVFAMHRVHVRAADLYESPLRAIQVWSVKPLFGDLPDVDFLLRDIKRVLSGELDLESKLEGIHSPDSSVMVNISRVSDQQTVVEVRARDRKALLYDISRAISACALTITGARISTLGLDAVDVFFIRNSLGQPPTEFEGQQVISAIRRHLAPEFDSTLQSQSDRMALETNLGG